MRETHSKFLMQLTFLSLPELTHGGVMDQSQKLEYLICLYRLPGMGVAETLRRLARDLSTTIDKKRTWTWNYLHQVSKGRLLPSTKLNQAICLLYENKFNGTPPPVLEAVQAVAPTGLVNATTPVLILVKPRVCARPGCGVIFLPRHPRQIFCGQVCRRRNHGTF